MTRIVKHRDMSLCSWMADTFQRQPIIGHGRCEALEIAKKANPLVILLNVVKAETDGPATPKTSRQNPDLSDVPTVFITAWAMESWEESHAE